MKERPILFSAAMVRALWDGMKTQTRRIVKPQPVFTGHSSEKSCSWSWGWKGKELAGKREEFLVQCPYGQPGDRLWVRESFWGCDLPGYGDQPCVVYDDEWVGKDYKPAEARPWGRKFGRIPSIHMPREASRILLEIVSVRVERLQDISEADAKAEGCERLQDDEPGYMEREEPDWKLCPRCGGTRLYTAYGPNGGACFDTDCTRCDTYAKRYRHLWESLNGAGSWDANPWVWAVEFRRID